MKYSSKNQGERQMEVRFNSRSAQERRENWELMKKEYDEKGDPGFSWFISSDPKECQYILYRDNHGCLLAVARCHMRKKKKETEFFIQYNFHPDGLDINTYNKIIDMTCDFWASEKAPTLLSEKN
jgi:hypothetical protein